jgi:hypothetical protein
MRARPRRSATPGAGLERRRSGTRAQPRGRRGPHDSDGREGDLRDRGGRESGGRDGHGGVEGTMAAEGTMASESTGAAVTTTVAAVAAGKDSACGTRHRREVLPTA